MKRWICGLSALFVVGCAGQDATWHKPGVSQADAQRDFYECERDTRTAAASFSGGLQGAGEAQAFYGRCMSARGYSLVRSSTSSGMFTSLPVYPPTPQRDATGRTFADNDRVMCMFPTLQAPVNLQAKACAQGGGTITGPAT